MLLTCLVLHANLLPYPIVGAVVSMASEGVCCFGARSDPAREMRFVAAAPRSAR